MKFSLLLTLLCCLSLSTLQTVTAAMNNEKRTPSILTTRDRMLRSLRGSFLKSFGGLIAAEAVGGAAAGAAGGATSALVHNAMNKKSSEDGDDDKNEQTPPGSVSVTLTQEDLQTWKQFQAFLKMQQTKQQ